MRNVATAHLQLGDFPQHVAAGEGPAVGRAGRSPLIDHRVTAAAELTDEPAHAVGDLQADVPEDLPGILDVQEGP
jgi:hypothetical protein